MVFTNTCVMQNYFISISKNQTLNDGTIHDPKSKLKVQAIDLSRTGLEPITGEVRYFVTAGNETIAFETKGYRKHRTLLVLQMISWYCIYLGLMEAQIHSSLPGFLNAS